VDFSFLGGEFADDYPGTRAIAHQTNRIRYNLTTNLRSGIDTSLCKSSAVALSGGRLVLELQHSRKI